MPTKAAFQERPRARSAAAHLAPRVFQSQTDARNRGLFWHSYTAPLQIDRTERQLRHYVPCGVGNLQTKQVVGRRSAVADYGRLEGIVAPPAYRGFAQDHRRVRAPHNRHGLQRVALE